MDDLLNHPHVNQLDHYLYVVNGPADKYNVLASQEAPGAWDVRPAIGSTSMRDAGLRSRDETQEWLDAHTVRLGSLEEAIRFALSRCGAVL